MRSIATDRYDAFLSCSQASDAALAVTEYWYRNEDATCCSSGPAVRWTYQDGVLRPGAPHITA